MATKRLGTAANLDVVWTSADPATPIELNGRRGLLLSGKDGHRSVLSFQVDGGRIVRIDVVRNPEKLRRVGPRPG